MPKEIPQELIEQICSTLQLETKAARPFLRVLLENAQLFDGKQKDYGSANIAKFGTFGCVVRMSDKFERLRNLFMNRSKRVVNESIRDTFKDISNYANIALLVESKQWPNE